MIITSWSNIREYLSITECPTLDVSMSIVVRIHLHSFGQGLDNLLKPIPRPPYAPFIYRKIPMDGYE